MTQVLDGVRQSTFPLKLLMACGIVLLGFVVLPFLLGNFQIALMSKLLLFGALAVSLDLVWGYTGILSFAHGVFFTLGGYVAAYYLKLNLSASRNNYGVDLPDFMVWNGLTELPWFIAPLKHFPIALLGVIVVPALFAYVLGWFIFRSKVSGVYITIMTLAISSALTTFFISQQAYTGGTNGITDVSRLSLFGIEVNQLGLYYLILIFTALVLAVGWWLTQSNLGLILRSIKENEKRIAFLGYDVASYKIFIWTLSAAIAGIAGGLFVPLNRFISPVYLAVAFGTQVVIWVAIGGRGTLVGPLVAAILLGQVQNYAERVTQDWQLVVGVLLLVVVLFLPDGLMSLLPKQFNFNNLTKTAAATNSSAGFVQARMLDWYTPLKAAILAIARLTATIFNSALSLMNQRPNQTSKFSRGKGESISTNSTKRK